MITVRRGFLSTVAAAGSDHSVSATQLSSSEMPQAPSTTSSVSLGSRTDGRFCRSSRTMPTAWDPQAWPGFSQMTMSSRALRS